MCFKGVECYQLSPCLIQYGPGCVAAALHRSSHLGKDVCHCVTGISIGLRGKGGRQGRGVTQR